MLRINGYYPPHQFMAALKYVAEKQEGRMTFPAYLARLAPPLAKRSLHGEPFFPKPPYDLSKPAGGRPVVTSAGNKTTARLWTDELNVAYVPSAVLFDGGKEAIRIEAFMKGYHVQSVLDDVVSGAYKTQPELQRFSRERADRLREHGVTIDLWE